MVTCEQCGSIQVVRVRSTPIDRVLALVTGRRLFLCRRCGWHARRKWADTQLVSSFDEWSPVRADIDPEMAVLDDIERRRRRRKRGKRARRRKRPESALATARQKPEFDPLDLGDIAAESQPIETAAVIDIDGIELESNEYEYRDQDPTDHFERPSRSLTKVNRTRRQEMFGVIAFGTVILSLVVLMMFAQSCRIEAAL